MALLSSFIRFHLSRGMNVLLIQIKAEIWMVSTRFLQPYFPQVLTVALQTKIIFIWWFSNHLKLRMHMDRICYLNIYTKNNKYTYAVILLKVVTFLCLVVRKGSRWRFKFRFWAHIYKGLQQNLNCFFISPLVLCLCKLLLYFILFT